MELRATNGIVVRLEGTTVELTGPLPETGDVASAQIAFGPAFMGGGSWGMSSSASLTWLTVTPTGGTHARAELWRSDVRGARSAGVPLPGVDVTAARALEKCLADARSAAAVVVDVTRAALFADPASYHGRTVRLTDVDVNVQFESVAIYHGDASFWVDVALPEGSYRLTGVGLFESEPGRGYGHFGARPGRWSVSQVLASRPIGRSFVEKVRKRVEAAAKDAFVGVARRTFGWEVAVSPPIPRPWPVTGKPGVLCFLLYGWGTSKSGEHHVGGIWGRACVPHDAVDAPIVVERFATTLEDLGAARPFAPDGFYAQLAPMFVGMAAEGVLEKGAGVAIKGYYGPWLATRPQLAAALKAEDPAFWAHILQPESP